MKIDKCLIMSAGLGTRMGPIGQHLPKVLWPIFNKTLLDLQIRYARTYGVKKIYINVHFLAEKIIKVLKVQNYADVEIIVEKDLLGTGGTIHEIARLERGEGVLLVMNGDQFYLPDPESIQNACDKIDHYDALLFTTEVQASSGYNKLISEHDRLVNIEQYKNFNSSYYTYSGMGFVNLAKLNYQHGFSDFFKTVADYKNRKVGLIKPDFFEYWDFGTSERYFESVFKILDNTNKDITSNFMQFCEQNGVTSGLNLTYFDQTQVIDLSANGYENKSSSPAIILANMAKTNIGEKGIYLNDLFSRA